MHENLMITMPKKKPTYDYLITLKPIIQETMILREQPFDFQGGGGVHGFNITDKLFFTTNEKQFFFFQLYS